MHNAVGHSDQTTFSRTLALWIFPEIMSESPLAGVKRDARDASGAKYSALTAGFMYVELLEFAYRAPHEPVAQHVWFRLCWTGG